MQGDWDKPLDKLTNELTELRETLRAIEECKDELRPELTRATGEVSTLVQLKNSQNSRTSIDPLYELPRVLSNILENPKIGALVFGAKGERLLLNNRALELLGDFLSTPELGGKGPSKISEAGGDGIFDTRHKRLQEKDLPWNFSQVSNEWKQSECEIILKSGGQERYLRVTVSPLASRQPGRSPGGLIAFLADITDHVKVVNELSQICRETEARLEDFTKGLDELKQLTEKLQASKKSESPQSVASPTAPAKPAEQPKETKLGAGLNVLVVDDVAVNQKLLKLQLDKLGFAVTLANDGREAVDAVSSRKTKFDLVLMDCDMPRLDGYDATREIRSLGGEFSQLPIIAVTAYDREGDRQKCLDAGMSDYITKGSPEKELKRRILEWCEVAAQRAKAEQDKEESLQGSSSIARAILFEEEKIDGPIAEDKLTYKELASIYGEAEAEEIAKLFIGVTSTFIECLELAITSKDLEATNHFAYSIKGPLSSLKLNHLADLSSKIPQSASKSKWKEAKKFYDELVSFYAPIKKELSR